MILVYCRLSHRVLEIHTMKRKMYRLTRKYNINYTEMVVKLRNCVLGQLKSVTTSCLLHIPKFCCCAFFSPFDVKFSSLAHDLVLEAYRRL